MVPLATTSLSMKSGRSPGVGRPGLLFKRCPTQNAWTKKLCHCVLELLDQAQTSTVRKLGISDGDAQEIRIWLAGLK